MRRLLIAIYIPAGLLSFANGMLVPTLPIFADTFGVSLVLVGVVLAAESFGMMLGDAPAGYLVGRLAPKTAMVSGVGLMAAAMLLTAVAPNVWVVIASRLVSGVGASFWNLSRHAYLTTATRSETRGRTMGLFAGTNRLGAFVGPVVGGLVGSAFGLRRPLVLYAVVAGLTVLFLALLLPPEERPTGASVVSGDAAKAALRKSLPALANVGTAQLMVQTLRAGRNALIPIYGSQVLGLDVDSVGLIVGTASLIDFSLFYPAGFIMDRYGRKTSVIPSFIIQGTAMALLPLTGGFSSLLAVAALGGLGNGLSTGSMMTLGADLAPRAALAQFLALWRLIGDAGTVGGPLLVGFVAQAAGLGVAGGAVGLVGWGAAAWFLFRVPETLKRRPVAPAQE